MNFNNIINKLAEHPEELEKVGDRRNMLKGFGTKLAAAAIPFAIGITASTEAKAQSKETINNVLNFILKNELLIDKIYSDALAVPALAPPQFQEQFAKMHATNQAHIEVLKQLLRELGGTPVTINYDKIDYSGGTGSMGGQFRNAMSVTADFLLLMQVLTETICRIYKGQISEVLSDKIVVRNLSCIHSVKARHATFIRFMRKFWIGDSIKPWITNTNSDSSNPSVQVAYTGESNTTQAGFEIIRINGYDITQELATQAFDEPLNSLDSNRIMNRFINPY